MGASSHEPLARDARGELQSVANDATNSSPSAFAPTRGTMVQAARIRRGIAATVVVAALALAVPAQSLAAGAVTTTPAQRATAVQVALSRVGFRYAVGATGPRRFDCSGLVLFAYRRAQHPLAGRTSYDFFAQGAPVIRRGLRPGDLVWTWDRTRGHVGIYIGGGRYVHAPGVGRRIEVAPLPSGAAFVGARRP
jgi:cell wall-associated NlpC family hydrolase